MPTKRGSRSARGHLVVAESVRGKRDVTWKQGGQLYGLRQLKGTGKLRTSPPSRKTQKGCRSGAGLEPIRSPLHRLSNSARASIRVPPTVFRLKGMKKNEGWDEKRVRIPSEQRILVLTMRGEVSVLCRWPLSFGLSSRDLSYQERGGVTETPQKRDPLPIEGRWL